MGNTPLLDLDATVAIEAYTDPVLAPYGLTVHGAYVDQFWLPLVGPSCVVLTRYIDSHHGDSITLARLGQALGLPNPRMLARTLERAERFGLVTRTPSLLRGRRYVAPLTPRQVAKLPGWLAEEHHARQAQRMAAEIR